VCYRTDTYGFVEDCVGQRRCARQGSDVSRQPTGAGGSLKRTQREQHSIEHGMNRIRSLALLLLRGPIAAKVPSSWPA
jgi:hypothetical protein